MAKWLGCRICRVDFARIELADGTVALVCSGCDVIGLEHEVAQGGPLWAAGSASHRPRSARAARRAKTAGKPRGHVLHTPLGN